MKTILTLFCLFNAASAFHAVVPTKSAPATARFFSTMRLHAVEYPKSFQRAVECSEKFGLCGVDELLQLADELESYEECYFEEGQSACEKEEMDRQDVADILRLEAELSLRQDYLKNANLFAGDVHDAEEQRGADKRMKAQAWIIDTE
jgi:hypothetical protein